MDKVDLIDICWSEKGSDQVLARIKPDGTWWIAPDITEKAAAETLAIVLEAAAKLLKDISDVRDIVQEHWGGHKAEIKTHFVDE